MTLTHEEFSRRGGKSRSAKKLAALQKTIVKAREKRWPKKLNLPDTKAVATQPQKIR